MPDGVASIERPRERLGAEYLGKARLITQKVKANDVHIRDTLLSIFEPLKQRMRDGHYSHRIEDLAAAVRQLDALPDYGLIAHTRTFDRRHRTLDEWALRIGTAGFARWSWNRGLEPALIVFMVTGKALKKQVSLHCDVLVAVTLHTLGRWYQRSFDTSEAALFADFKDLALHYDTLLEQAKPQPHKWFYETKNGRYVGQAVRHGERIMVSTDTFMHPIAGPTVTWSS